VLEWILAIFHLGQFDYSHGEVAGNILLTSSRGMWAIKWSFIGLMITAAMQVVIVYFSGSVALLADTIHNFGDAVTAIPLWIAFTLARRPATRRYTYGYGRAEDLAGVAVVGLILFSAVVAAYQAIDRIIHPQAITNLEWVAAAGLIGFLGNEAVAIFRMRVGREIGSAALIADGQHARVDGLTSLAVLAGAVGVWLGFPLADPLIGLLISAAIVRIAWNATKQMWYRMMDAAEPAIVDKVEHTARSVPGVRGVHCVRARWVGHRLFAEAHIEVDQALSVVEEHHINEEVQHALYHALPRLSEAAVHVDLACEDQSLFHQSTLHHRDEATTALAAGSGAAVPDQRH
jgi:cation diffusion facilitator family transporter